MEGSRPWKGALWTEDMASAHRRQACLLPLPHPPSRPQGPPLRPPPGGCTPHTGFPSVIHIPGMGGSESGSEPGPQSCSRSFMVPT